MQVFGISDVGKKRNQNEDNFCVEHTKDAMAAVVCDGMGGAVAGEVASSLACRKFLDTLMPALTRVKEKASSRSETVLAVERAISAAAECSNKEVFNRSEKDKNLSGMGTTIAGCLVMDDILWTFNVGDSRVYHISEKTAEQLTVDHSLVQALVDSGKITPEEAENHPNKNVILRAVGVDKKVECDICHMNLDAGYYLICSDGLSNYFNEPVFVSLINSRTDLAEKAEALVAYANSMGGADNITAVLIDTEKRYGGKS